MAISTVNEIDDGRDGDDGITRSGGGVQHYTRIYRVITDSNTTEGEAVLLSASLPRLGAFYPYNSNAYLQRRIVRSTGFGKRVWIVTCSYSTERELSEDPTAEPADISWNTESYQEPFHKTIDDKPCANSAGDPFDPLPERDDPRVTATIIKNLVAVPVWIFQYRTAVNSAAFVIDGVGVEKGLAKVSSIQVGGEQTRNDIPYRVVTMQIQFKSPDEDEDGKEWHVSPLDAGFRQRNDKKELVNIKNQKLVEGSTTVYEDSNEDITAPVALDGQGKVEPNPTFDNAKYIHLKAYPELDFSVLPLV